MTQQEHADKIRASAQQLRDDIAAAQADRMEVQPPLALQNWLTTGHAPGELTAWTIKPPKSL